MSLSEEGINNLLLSQTLCRKNFKKAKAYALSDQDVYCCFCGKKLNQQTATIEHIRPYSKLRRNQNRVENLTISCAKCNLERGVADFHEYRKYYTKGGNPPEGCRDYYRVENAKKINKRLIKEILELLSAGYNINEISKAKNIKSSKVKHVIMLWL